jgi:flavin reductase (DIM6/NTAB) family NADH-FMN oxidoreductase RutF
MENGMKRKLGPVNALYPSLTTIVGSVVDGRPNFLAIAHVGIMNHGQPQYITIGVNTKHYSVRGIEAHREFSVNIPGEGLMAETDYVGIVSGKTTDKSGVFETFAGELAHAPLIKGCPVCMECRLDRVIDFNTHAVYVGEIVATHADEEVLRADGSVDIAKVRPLLFDMASMKYWSLGGEVGQCWGAGKELKRALRGQADAVD